ncbi:hypothetical protein B0T25DRAFT_141143 [Lasiosphaeria hispida]|uniref:DUF2293 domain-containing protein n=1 Tax=Lasiosphaeria hispida TaxID=260671 RepID=A0AAJ0MFX2_9PEZI|nr:hypothetical protein B0T25DRAFT_141143 [Lasiosphaeria hispida]
MAEPEVRFFSPMPDGYQFVPKGDVYITKNCRKRTHEAGQTLYVVVNKANKPLGLRCPIPVYHAVVTEHHATATKRASAVQKRDAAIEDTFEQELVNLFPQTPQGEIPKILNQALKKRSRRVGRAGKVDLQERVKLAVRAHIRHCHTEYDQFLSQGVSRDDARDTILNKLNEVARQWGGRVVKPANQVSHRVGVQKPQKSKQKTSAGTGTGTGTGTGKLKKGQRGPVPVAAGKRRSVGLAKKATVLPSFPERTRRVTRSSLTASGDLEKGQAGEDKRVYIVISDDSSGDGGDGGGGGSDSDESDWDAWSEDSD